MISKFRIVYSVNGEYGIRQPSSILRSDRQEVLLSNASKLKIWMWVIPPILFLYRYFDT
jgi:hypothetical protein